MEKKGVKSERLDHLIPDLILREKDQRDQRVGLMIGR